PAVAAVLMAHAVLALERGRAPFEMVLEEGLDLAEVVGVDPAEPLEGSVADVLRLAAEHRLPALGVVDLVGLQGPVPEAVVDALGGEGVALLAGAEGFLGVAA